MRECEEIGYRQVVNVKKKSAIRRKMLSALLHACLLAGLIAPSTTHSAASATDDQYVFYGYAPPTVKPIYYRFAEGGSPEHMYVGSPPQLTIVGVHDDTSIEVYDLNDRGVIASFSINRMELRRVSLTNETYFKVVSDRLVSVLLSGGGWKSNGVIPVHMASTFYPSTEGGYVGYQFIFAPTNSTDGLLQIFFIEGARVTIQDAGGNVIAEVEGTPGETKTTNLEKVPGEVYFLALEAYRVVSTGRIMLAGLSDNSFLYLPALTGGFVGRHFLAVRGGAIIVVALEDTEVAFYDLKRPSWHITLLGPDEKRSLSAGEWYNASMGANTRIDATGNISVLIGDGGGWHVHWASTYLQRGILYPEHIGDDVSFVVVRPGQEFGFFVPTEAVLFAHEESTIQVDGAMVTVKEDEYLRLAQGVHMVKATAPVTIEILGHGSEYDFQGGLGYRLAEHYDNYASYLVSSQGFTENYPEPPGVGGLGEITPYIGIGVAIPILLVIAILIRKRSKKRKTE